MAETSSAAAAPLPEREEPGAALYREAEARYVAGDLAGALSLMQKSYDASGRPELLFNLGQLHRDLGHCVEARKSYERYLTLAKSGTRRDEAERRARELGLECPDGAAVLAEPHRAEAPKPYWTPTRIAAWSTLGGSVVLAASATYFAVRASSKENALEDQLHQAESAGDSYTEADKKREEELQQEGHRAAMLARGLGIGAAGLAAVGVTLLLLNPEPRETTTNGLSVRWSRDGATATYRGEF